MMSPHRQPTAVLDRPNPFAALFQEITEIAQAALRRSAYFELRAVTCDFRGGVLTLRGRLPSYHLKQIAQTAVAEVPGVVEVDNRVEVTAPRPTPNSAWSRHGVLVSAEQN
jgi:osmotically-inducible protein OsmY